MPHFYTRPHGIRPFNTATTGRPGVLRLVGRVFCLSVSRTPSSTPQEFDLCSTIFQLARSERQLCDAKFGLQRISPGSYPYLEESDADLQATPQRYRCIAATRSTG